MNRRTFTLGIGAIGGLMAIPAPIFALAQSNAGSEEGLWKSELSDFEVVWEADSFGSPSTDSSDENRSERVSLRIATTAPKPHRVCAVWITISDDFAQSDEELRDFVENDPDLSYGLTGTDNQRVKVVEKNGAFGVLYRPVFEGRTDTWSYNEYSANADELGRGSEIWLSGTRTEWNREEVEAALETLQINGESLLRAIELDELCDLIDDLEVS